MKNRDNAETNLYVNGHKIVDITSRDLGVGVHMESYTDTYTKLAQSNVSLVIALR